MTNDERRTAYGYALSCDYDTWVSSLLRHSSFELRPTRRLSQGRLIDEFTRGHRAPIFFAADGRVFLLRRRDGLVDNGHELGPHLLQAFTIEQSLFENQL